MTDNARSRKAKEAMKTKQQDTKEATELQIDTSKQTADDKEKAKAQSKNQELDYLAKYANAKEKEIEVGDVQRLLQLGESVTGMFVLQYPAQSHHNSTLFDFHKHRINATDYVAICIHHQII